MFVVYLKCFVMYLCVLDCISADNGDGSRTLAAIALQNAPFSFLLVHAFMLM